MGQIKFKKGSYTDLPNELEDGSLYFIEGSEKFSNSGSIKLKDGNNIYEVSGQEKICGEEFEAFDPPYEALRLDQIKTIRPYDPSQWTWDGVLTEDDLTYEFQVEGKTAIMGLHKVTSEVFAPEELYGCTVAYHYPPPRGEEEEILDNSNVFEYQGLTMVGASALVVISGRGSLDWPGPKGQTITFTVDGTYFGLEGYKEGFENRSYTSRLSVPGYQANGLEGHSFYSRITEPMCTFSLISSYGDKIPYVFEGSQEDLDAFLDSLGAEDDEQLIQNLVNAKWEYKIGDNDWTPIEARYDTGRCLVRWNEGEEPQEARAFDCKAFYFGSTGSYYLCEGAFEIIEGDTSSPFCWIPLDGEMTYYDPIGIYEEGQELQIGLRCIAKSNITKIDDKFLPAQLQSDWYQNDASKIDYIKNRICYPYYEDVNIEYDEMAFSATKYDKVNMYVLDDSEEGIPFSKDDVYSLEFWNDDKTELFYDFIFSPSDEFQPLSISGYRVGDTFGVHSQEMIDAMFSSHPLTISDPCFMSLIPEDATSFFPMAVGNIFNSDSVEGILVARKISQKNYAEIDENYLPSIAKTATPGKFTDDDGSQLLFGEGRPEIFNNYEGDLINTAIGSSSHAEGEATIAIGVGSHAEGQEACTYGNYSHAEGVGAAFAPFARYRIYERNGEWFCEYKTTNKWPSVGYKKEEDFTWNICREHLLRYSSPDPNGYKLVGVDKITPRTTKVFSTIDDITSSNYRSRVTKKKSLISDKYKYSLDVTVVFKFDTSDPDRATPSPDWTKKVSTNYGAFGIASHAEGYCTKANGNYSHASGFHTTTDYESQTTVGRYNNPDAYALFVVGTGSSDYSRSNGFTVSDSRTEVYNDLVIQGTNASGTEARFKISVVNGALTATEIV